MEQSATSPERQISHSPDAENRIDPCVIERSDPQAEVWADGIGHRLYSLSKADTLPMHVLTMYTREISDGTGDVVEKETITGAGCLSPNVPSLQPQPVLDEVGTLYGDDLGGYEYTTGVHFCEMFQAWAEKQLMAATGYQLTPDGNHVRLGISIQDVEPQTKFGASDVEVFLNGLSNVSDVVDSVHSDPSFDTDWAICGEVAFSIVESWELRAVELHYCGPIPSMELSRVAALLWCSPVETQAEVADRLGKAESTVSEHVSRLEELMAGIEWFVMNRSNFNQ